ncbi:MAG: serine/threonine-protein kinase [Rhodothermia bacterium]|nr:MAG: serine/threonine-protein kinase [Rhodothermia bacterium]
MIGRTFSHYKIETELGRGGMGIVYLAADTKLDRRVAIKFLAPDLTTDKVAKERFIREAKAAAAVEHESICAIYEIGEVPLRGSSEVSGASAEEIGETSDGQTYIVMPYYEGNTLKELIAEGPMDPLKVLDLATQIAGGLSAAHSKGVVHRDIKPGNILVGHRGRIKILDFGLAKLGGQMDLTKSRSSIGTVPYMAPEQIRGETSDERTDIWALGAVMFEMLAGTRPFHGEYEQAVAYTILNVDPPPLRTGLPEGLEDLIIRCLAKDPAHRYQSAQKLLEDIEMPSGVRPFSDSITRGPVTQSESAAAGKIAAIAVLIAIIFGVSFLALRKFSKPQGPSDRHVAILPFRVIGESNDVEAFSYGLLETLTSSLTRLQQTHEFLWVVPTSEVNASMTISDANRLLGANLVVTGSVQLDGEQLRISLTLNDATTLRSIDSDQIDDTGSGAFAIQDEAVLRLIRMLKIESEAEDVRALAPSASYVRSANDAYLKAKGYLRNQQSIEELDVAIGLLTSAINDDSLFASAYSELGLAYWFKFQHTEDTRWVDEAFEFSQEALRLNDQLSEVHVTLATINSGRSDYDAALEDYQRALEIDPLNSEAYRLQASSLRAVGRIADAKASLDRSIQLAPDYWRGYYSLALHHFRQEEHDEVVRVAQLGLDRAPDVLRLINIQAASLWSQGRVAEAILRFDRIRELDSEYTTAWANTATALFYTGRFDEAVELYEKVVNRYRPNSYDYRGYLADAYYWAEGKRNKAESTYEQAIDLARTQLEVSEIDPAIYGSIAGFFAHLDEPDSAILYLNRAIELSPPGTMPPNRAIGIGETYVTLGEFETAKTWLEQGLSQNAGWMKLQFSPWLAEIREDLDFMDRIAVYRD